MSLYSHLAQSSFEARLPKGGATNTATNDTETDYADRAFIDQPTTLTVSEMSVQLVSPDPSLNYEGLFDLLDYEIKWLPSLKKTKGKSK